MGMGMGTGMGGSVRDKASQRDLLRADAAPVAVDPKLGFQVPYLALFMSYLAPHLVLYLIPI